MLKHDFEEKIIHAPGNRTICIMEGSFRDPDGYYLDHDKVRGMTICDAGDNYDPDQGKKIARSRALIKAAKSARAEAKYRIKIVESNLADAQKNLANLNTIIERESARDFNSNRN